MAEIAEMRLAATPTVRLSLRANFSWTLAGNIVYNACQWGLVVVLAKLGSPELLGQYTIALAITTPVFSLSNSGLRTVQATDVQDANPFGDYLGLRLVCSLLGLGVIAGILRMGGCEGAVGIVALVSLAKFIESISDISYGQMQRRERLDLVSRSLMLRGQFALAGMAVALYTTRSLVAALVAQALVWGTVLWSHDLVAVRRWEPVRPRFIPRRLLSLLLLGLPLGMVAGLNSLSTQVPRYAIAIFSGQRELGVFAAITSLGVVVNLVTTALSRSALPRLSVLYARGALAEFLRLLLRLMGLGAGIGVLGVIGSAFLGRQFLRIVYTEEYAAFTNVLMVTMATVGVLAAATFLGTALAATRQFAVQTLIHIAKLAAIGIACYLLVPGMGILGAACAALGGALLSSSAYLFVLWRTIRRARHNSTLAV